MRNVFYSIIQNYKENILSICAIVFQIWSQIYHCLMIFGDELEIYIATFKIIATNHCVKWTMESGNCANKLFSISSESLIEFLYLQLLFAWSALLLMLFKSKRWTEVIEGFRMYLGERKFVESHLLNFAHYIPILFKTNLINEMIQCDYQ